MDGSADWWGPSCRVVAGPGVAPARTSRQLFFRLVSKLISRFSSLTLGLYLDFRVEAVMPCSSSARTANSSLTAVAPLSLTQVVLCRIHCLLCPSLLSYALYCWAAADLDAVLAISESGGACCTAWALTLFCQAPLHTKSQISLCIFRSVTDAFFSRVTPHSLCSG